MSVGTSVGSWTLLSVTFVGVIAGASVIVSVIGTALYTKERGAAEFDEVTGSRMSLYLPLATFAASAGGIAKAKGEMMSVPVDVCGVSSLGKEGLQTWGCDITL